MALLIESVTHLDRVFKVIDLPQAFYRWESSLKEFERGRPAELDDDVKANAMRQMMPKGILDAVNLQPQYRTFSEVRDHMLQMARQRADVYVGDVCHPTKKIGSVTPTCEDEHEHSHRHKSRSSGPNGCVPEKLERLKN